MAKMVYEVEYRALQEEIERLQAEKDALMEALDKANKRIAELERVQSNIREILSSPMHATHNLQSHLIRVTAEIEKELSDES